MTVVAPSAGTESPVERTAPVPVEVTPVNKVPQGSQANVDLKTEDGGFNALWSLLNRSLFFDYFMHVAEHRFLDSDVQVRVQKQKKDHPKWYWFAITMDSIVKIATTAIFLGVTTALAIKVIA